MPNNDKVTIWGGVPRFGTTPTTGQAIAGGGNGFVIYDSAEDNTGIVVIAQTPLPNKNMELAQKTVAGVTTQYYGFAGYLGSYYSTSTQTQALASTETLVYFEDSQIQYLTNVLGTPKTKITALHPGVYRISGTLAFYADEAKGATSVTITLSGSAPLDPTSAPVSTGNVASASGTGASQNITIASTPTTITVNGQTITISGQTVSGQTVDLSGVSANLSGITSNVNISWADVALERYVNVWLKKNGTRIDWTGRNYKLIGDFGKVMAEIDYLVDMAKDDYVEIAWFGFELTGTPLAAVLDTNVKLNYDGSYLSTNYPSALINMTLVR